MLGGDYDLAILAGEVPRLKRFMLVAHSFLRTGSALALAFMRTSDVARAIV
jgi:hypothetical protein